VRRTLVERLGGFEESFPGLYDDQVFYAKVCLNAPVFVSNECLARYRRHAGSLCARTEHTAAHDIWRQRYLRWLSHYVSEVGIADRDLARALRTQLWIWGKDSDSRMLFWTRRLLRKTKQALVRFAT
jgi:hypothetical protein